MFWQVIVSVIVSKGVMGNVCMILNSYRERERELCESGAHCSSLPLS